MTAPVELPTRPTRLGKKARDFWDACVKAYELNPGELQYLEHSCREIDIIERLEKELQTAELTVKGSMGQEVSSPLVSELRQHRTTLKSLIQAMRMGEDATSGSSSAAGRALAGKRWG